MGLLSRFLVLILLLAATASLALAEDGNAKAASNVATQAPGAVLTAKERLGLKWTDEQRMDNCNVPLDKRGRKPRPDICPSTPTS